MNPRLLKDEIKTSAKKLFSPGSFGLRSTKGKECSAKHKGSGWEHNSERNDSHWTTHQVTPRSTFHLKKLLVPQLIKKFGKFYKSRSFSTAFTKAATWIPFTLLPPILLRSILVSSSQVLLCLPSVIFPPVFPTKPCTNFSCPPPTRATCPSHLIPLDLITLSSTNHDGPRHPTSLLIHLPCYDQVLSSAP